MDQILQLLEMLVPIIVGIIGVPLFAELKQLVTLIDKAPVWLQRLLVAFQTWLLALASGFLGQVLPGDLAAFDLSTVEQIIAAVLAYVLHFIQKQSGK